MASQDFTFARKPDGSAWGWGYNHRGQLGDETTTDKSSPISVVGNHSFVAIHTQLATVLGLKYSGECWSWGTGTQGRLGDGTTDDKSSPISVIGDHAFIQIAAGPTNGSGLKDNGSVWTWGRGYFGQLGNNTAGSGTDKSSPVSVVGNHFFSKLFFGFYHVIALKNDGSAWTWGYNNHGQLGDETTTDKSSPISVVGSHSFVAAAGGNYHTLALKDDGHVWAWGYNNKGQLGDDTITERSSPVSVVGNHSFIAIAAGQTHSLGLKANGECWSWGYNTLGQLGINWDTDWITSPDQVVGDHSFIQIAAGYTNSYGLKDNGEVWSWGDNDKGQLGDNTTTVRSSPVLVVGSHVFDLLMQNDLPASSSFSSSSFSSCSSSFSSSSWSSYSFSGVSSSCSSSSSFSSSSSSFSSSSSSYSSSSSSYVPMNNANWNTFWNIRTDGDDNNGVGFADLDPGTSVNYIDQINYEHEWTDLAMVAGGTTLTSASGNFTAAMAGNCIYIRSGINFVVSYYQIVTFTNANSVEIDRDATNGSNASSGTGRVGGARQTITDTFLEQVAPGNTIFVKQGTYTLTSDINVANLGTIKYSIKIYGYSNSLDVNDYPSFANQPLIDCDTYDFTLPKYWRVRTINFKMNNTNGVRLSGIANFMISCRVEQTSVAGHGIFCDNAGGRAMRIIDTHIFSSAVSPTGTAIRVNALATIINCCKIWDFANGIHVLPDQHYMVSDGNIISDCSDSGIKLEADSAYIRTNTIYGCDIGVNGNTVENTHIRNSLIDSNISTGVLWAGTQMVFCDFNNWYNNGADVSGAGVVKGYHTTSYDPLFTNAPNRDFSLQPGSPAIATGANLNNGVGA